MSAYAVFGATGNCGTSLIQQLLQLPDAKIHAYCRNKTKLATLIPEALESRRIAIFEGNISDVDIFERCIRGCKAVFLAVSTNQNTPKYHVAEDTTKTLLSAMERLKKDGLRIPKVVVLSSASLEDSFCRNMARVAHWIIVRTNSYIYEDLRVQENLLRREQDWISTIFIKPGGLAVGPQRGHKLDLEEQETFVSYFDLAAGMVEAANDPDNRYDMKNVTIHNTGGTAKMPSFLPLLCVVGLITHFMPWLHPILPSVG